MQGEAVGIPIILYTTTLSPVLASPIERPMTVRAGPSIVYTEQYDQATPIVTNTGFAIIGPLGILFPTDAAYRLRGGLPPVITPIEADLVPGFGVAFGTSALNQILGGWTISTIIEARTGPLFSVY